MNIDRKRFLIKEPLFKEARNKCSICGTNSVLNIAHINPYYAGGTSTPDNIIVLCQICHTWVDRIGVPPQILIEIKRDWIEKEILGRDRIITWIENDKTHLQKESESTASQNSFFKWQEYISTNRTFDQELLRARAKIQTLKSEDELIHDILRPIFLFLGFEGITVLHHTGAPEHGKDMVFYQRDYLGSLTFYAVVACNTKIHTTSSKTSDSGHYAKLMDQINKCFYVPWQDKNLKTKAYIDKVVVVTSAVIVDAAQIYFTNWEEKERRHLIYLDGENLAGLLVQLWLGKEKK